MIKRIEKPALIRAIITTYTAVAAKAAAATAVAATVVRTERTFIKVKILGLKKLSNKKLFIKIKKIILFIFIVRRL